MNRKVFGSAMVLAFGLTGALAAQGPTGSQATTPGQQHGMAAGNAVTVEGCLVREKDVPGRQPNVAERAGVQEDYILTNVKFVKGSPHGSADASASAATSATGTTGATGSAASEQPAGTSGMAAVMLEVRGLDDSKLQPLVGQRVQIEGRVNPQDFSERRSEKANPAGEAAGDLPELHGTVIKKAESAEPCTGK